MDAVLSEIVFDGVQVMVVIAVVVVMIVEQGERSMFLLVELVGDVSGVEAKFGGVAHVHDVLTTVTTCQTTVSLHQQLKLVACHAPTPRHHRMLPDSSLQVVIQSSVRLRQQIVRAPVHVLGF